VMEGLEVTAVDLAVMVVVEILEVVIWGVVIWVVVTRRRCSVLGSSVISYSSADMA
jgi:hypothetical protein